MSQTASVFATAVPQKRHVDKRRMISRLGSDYVTVVVNAWGVIDRQVPTMIVTFQS